jgi:hypothetical protein
MPGNYQPRRTTQTTTTGGFQYLPTAGDIALGSQQQKYELLSQQFVAGIQVTKDGRDITLQAQNVLLALAANNQMTLAQAQAYQPKVSPEYWGNGITDWLATYNAQVARAAAGW